MDKFTPDKLRSEFIAPLASIVAELTAAANELESLHARGEIKADWLPLNEGAATRALIALRKFTDAEVKTKLRGAKEGWLRFRAAELKFGKKDQK